MSDIAGISSNDGLDASHTGTNRRETDVQSNAANQPKRLTEMRNQESLESPRDSGSLQQDARTTNQVETSQSREAGNDNKSRTEASRTLGKVVDVFA